LKKIFEIIPFFLFTIPLFLIVHIENVYQNHIIYKFVKSEIIELFAASLIIAGIFFLLVRNLHRACVYALPVILIFYFFCDLKDSLYNWNDKIFISKYAFLLPTIIILLLLIFRWIRKSKSDFRKLFLFVNVTFVFFIFYEVTGIAISDILGNRKNQSKHSINSDNYISCDSCVHPDIYYFVFDAYTSSRVLQSEFNYNNAHLDSFLKRKHFYIVANSRSNYNLTPFSIGSTLNFDYLQGLNTKKAYYLNDYLPGVSIVNENKLIPILRKEGYEIFNHSIFKFKDFPSTIPAFDLWELNLVYERHNIFKNIDKDIGWLIRRYLHFTKIQNDDNFTYEIERDKHFTNTVTALLQTIKSKNKSPKFTYGHLLLPHKPYTYDHAGNKIPFTRKKMTIAEDKNAYINQLRFTNKIVDTLVQSILLYAKKPSIIILQSDHGYKYFDDRKKDLEFANLNAIYFYNQNYKLLNDSLSNVNTFRVVLNTFFKKRYPLLKDTSYFLQYK